MKFIKFIWELPIAFIVNLYGIYIIIRISQDSELYDLLEIETEEQLTEILQPYMEAFELKYMIHLNVWNILIWLTFLKIILLP